jgi:DNA-binding FrmR family transcriptional regulator
MSSMMNQDSRAPQVLVSRANLVRCTIGGYSVGQDVVAADRSWLEGWMRGYSESKEQLQTRLRRVEGQVRGLQRMVDEDAYCIDVLTQISAVNAALRSVAVVLLDDHLRHCVRDAAGDDTRSDAIVTEASAAINRLLKS